MYKCVPYNRRRQIEDSEEIVDSEGCSEPAISGGVWLQELDLFSLGSRRLASDLP